MEQEKINIIVDLISDELKLSEIISLFNLDSSRKDWYFVKKEDSFYCTNCSSFDCHCSRSMWDEILEDLYFYLQQNEEVWIKIFDLINWPKTLKLKVQIKKILPSSKKLVL